MGCERCWGNGSWMPLRREEGGRVLKALLQCPVDNMGTSSAANSVAVLTASTAERSPSPPAPHHTPRTTRTHLHSYVRTKASHTRAHRRKKTLCPQRLPLVPPPTRMPGKGGPPPDGPGRLRPWPPSKTAPPLPFPPSPNEPPPPSSPSPPPPAAPCSAQLLAAAAAAAGAAPSAMTTTGTGTAGVYRRSASHAI